MLEVADMIEIEQVLNHVHHIIDERAFASLHLVYAEDAIYDLSYRNLPPAKGIAAISELCASSYKQDFSHLVGHHATNIYIYEDENGVVRAKSKVICVMEDGTSTSADFNDVITKTSKGWRIQQRVASTRHRHAENWTKSSD